MKKSKKILVGVLAGLLLLAGCESEAEPQVEVVEEPVVIEESNDPVEEAAVVEEEQAPAPEVEEVEAEPTIEDRKAAIDLSVKPNEAGKVMVLMYHNIGDEEKTWTRTPDNFRRDLETLYEKGYRPISLNDYVKGTFDIPAGMTPFVMTFDDGNENNFRYLETENGWEIDPDCAVGILEAFRADHEDFDPQASFFVYSSRPFRQEDLVEKKLTFLVKKGYEVGNHSWGHDDYKEEKYNDPLNVQESLGRNVAFLETYLEAGTVNTLALPYGHRPKDDTAEAYLSSGVYEGVEYENIAILNVGWDPDKSPYHKDFDPTAIHRVRASETNVDNVGLYDWLDSFDKHPERRYISDGDPEIVTVPENRLDSLAEAYQAGGEMEEWVYSYSQQEEE